MIIVDYIPAKECKNEEVIYTCLKCEKCGRRFECGIMETPKGNYRKEKLCPSF